MHTTWTKKLPGLVLAAIALFLFWRADPAWVASGIGKSMQFLSSADYWIAVAVCVVVLFVFAGSFIGNALCLLIISFLLPELSYEPMDKLAYELAAWWTGSASFKTVAVYNQIHWWLSASIYTTLALAVLILLHKLTHRHA